MQIPQAAPAPPVQTEMRKLVLFPSHCMGYSSTKSHFSDSYFRDYFFNKLDYVQRLMAVSHRHLGCAMLTSFLHTFRTTQRHSLCPKSSCRHNGRNASSKFQTDFSLTGSGNSNVLMILILVFVVFLDVLTSLLLIESLWEL